ncbi:UNVERIFIED_CONTAM: hypothetical protein Slati_3469600 [Sesamum latifolium]|uniref:DUF4283 domain-containing protein n=1 Tax=Sesamum latifolium TaxID=2727402 RepID=A0AAW2UI87_9LAMI
MRLLRTQRPTSSHRSQVTVIGLCDLAYLAITNQWQQADCLLVNPYDLLSFLVYSGATIADAFNNSSRKMLSYVAPVIQNDEIVVQPTLAMSRDGAPRWASTAMGYFLDKKSYFHHVKEFVRSTWPLVMDVTVTLHGFYFFRFKTVAAMEEWETGMALRKHKYTQVPVWLRLKHLLVEFWTNEGLSIITSGIGRPLYQDAITKACTRLDFARVCVMLDISSKLPKHVAVMIPRDDGGEVPCRVDVEYEWLLPKCTACQSLGHKTAECPDMRRQPTPAVHVFVPKNLPPHQADLRPRPQPDPRPRQQPVPRPQQDLEPRDRPSSRSRDPPSSQHQPSSLPLCEPPLLCDLMMRPDLRV